MTKLEQLKAAYYAAFAEKEAVHQKADRVQSEMLAAVPFMKGPEFLEAGEDPRILDPKDADMMLWDDFGTFSALCYEGYVREGIADPRGVDYCPEAIPAEKLRAAEDELLRVLLDFAGKECPASLPDLATAARNATRRPELIRLALRMPEPA